MNKEILNTENLSELYEQLDEFAKYHQNKGGHEAHKIVKAIWDKSKEGTRDGSPDGLNRDEGFDNAFKFILSKLHDRFVP